MKATRLASPGVLEHQHGGAERGGELEPDRGQQVERRDDARSAIKDQRDQARRDREDQLQVVVHRVADVGEDRGRAGHHGVRAGRRGGVRGVAERAAGEVHRAVSLSSAASSATSMRGAGRSASATGAPTRRRRGRAASSARSGCSCSAIRGGAGGRT